MVEYESYWVIDERFSNVVRWDLKTMILVLEEEREHVLQNQNNVDVDAAADDSIFRKSKMDRKKVSSFFLEFWVYLKNLVMIVGDHVLVLEEEMAYSCQRKERMNYSQGDWLLTCRLNSFVIKLLRMHRENTHSSLL